MAGYDAMLKQVVGRDLAKLFQKRRPNQDNEFEAGGNTGRHNAQIGIWFNTPGKVLFVLNRAYNDYHPPLYSIEDVREYTLDKNVRKEFKRFLEYNFVDLTKMVLANPGD
jgi:hypothetical protein